MTVMLPTRYMSLVVVGELWNSLLMAGQSSRMKGGFLDRKRDSKLRTGAMAKLQGVRCAWDY